MYKPKHQWIVDFEGLDRCGKTTTKVALAKRLNQDILCYDRGTVSLEAYAKRYNRNNYSTQIEEFYLSFPFHLIAYHYCDKETFEKRIKETHHEYVDYDFDTKCFNEALNHHKEKGAKIVYLNTSELSTEECVDKILEKIKFYESHIYGYIYLLTEKSSGKQYIGQHKFSNKYDKPFPTLENSYLTGSSYIRTKFRKNNTKFTEENFLQYFDRKIVCYASSYEELNRLETFWIQYNNTLWPNGLNFNEGGDSPKMSKETRQKLSNIKKKKYDENVKSCLHMSKLNNNRHWYNNGIKEKFEYDCPEGYSIGRLSSSIENSVKSMIQYHINNDNFNTTTGFHWYTDGNDNKFSKECPSGYKKGRLKHQKSN